MKKIIICFLLAVSTFLYAQDKKEEINYSDHASMGLLFSFSGLDKLNANAYLDGIGVKFFVINALAIRAGFNFNSDNTTIPVNPSDNYTGIDGEESSLQFGLNAAIEVHVSKGRVSPFFGGGFSYANYSSKQSGPVSWREGGSRLAIKETTEISGVNTITMFAMAGVELFIIENISLAAEYQFGYRSHAGGEEKETQKVVNGTSDYYPITNKTKNPDISGLGFNTAGFLTLSVYF